jgi:hypothetical protein
MEDQARTEWPQFVELVGLHKFYFEHLIKAAAFSLGIQGAFVAYVAQAGLGNAALRIALAFPLLLAVATALVFCLSLSKTRDLKRQVEALQQRLGLAWRPHVEVLVWMSLVFVALFGLATAGLVLLMCCGSRYLAG